ncbi:uncharacterized protein LOC129761101 [Toxorhynchites rutilus septentrionalis]|uniref:uncharacterized protein LOC129761101 n=1 Tax=Toxorhynchites rutilus septentrionalis TaxID=329112 RepID=UPI0024795F61|nr:uncharacterized protein LOC129761101 [Toxorhynchites rutilus septentrionalis]
MVCKQQDALNPSKCSVISFSRKRSSIIFEYKLHGVKLDRVSTIKDLGVMLDSKLTFRDHVSYIIAKASRTLGFIFRVTKRFKDVHCSLVRSILEYACVVWSPYYQNSVHRIESIQRKFIRFALRNLPFTNLPN